MDAWIVDILKGYGLAGVVIFCLIGVVIAQSRTIKGRDAELKRLHEQRAVEREKLVALLAGANEAQRITAEVTSKRNEIMQDLASAVMTQANANDRFADKVANQADMFREKFGDFRQVVDSFGESNRVLTGLVAEVRNVLIGMGTKIDAMPAAVGAAISQIQGRA
jgi:hypothetical protein